MARYGLTQGNGLFFDLNLSVLGKLYATAPWLTPARVPFSLRLCLNTGLRVAWSRVKSRATEFPRASFPTVYFPVVDFLHSWRCPYQYHRPSLSLSSLIALVVPYRPYRPLSPLSSLIALIAVLVLTVVLIIPHDLDTHFVPWIPSRVAIKVLPPLQVRPCCFACGKPLLQLPLQSPQIPQRDLGCHMVWR